MPEKKAFTLVEMLIVIAIVAILALLAIGSFGAARQQARREIAIDSLVSLLRQQQTLAKSGRLEEDFGSNRCYGVLYTIQDPYVQLVEMPYVPVGTTDADYCDPVAREAVDYDAIQDFEVREIERFGSDTSDVLILFKPPFARPVLGDVTFTSLDDLMVQSTSDIIIRVGLPNDEQVRAFRFDASSGLIERIHESIE